MRRKFQRNKNLGNKGFVYKEALPNGLRVLVHEMPWAQSVSARLLVSAGPRWEDDKTTGTAHYLEHMIFEGSQKYPSRRELDKAIENFGGDQNAYTQKEYVMYQAKVPSEHAGFATEFVREFVFNPLMSEEAVAREKGIITAELKRSNDDPNNHSWQLLREFVWRGHSLGHNTLGTFDSIQAITKEDLIKYHQKFYRPDNTILVIAGNIDGSKAIDLAMKDFGSLSAHPDLGFTVPTPQFVKQKQRVFIENKKLEETRILMAFSTEGRGENSPELPEIQVLSKIMRKTIFHKFVYDLGISYSAFCYPWLVSDNGSLVVGAGVHPERTDEAIDVIVNEVNRLEITNESLKEAKEALKGELTLDIADTDDYAHFIGEQELYTGIIKSPEQVRLGIDRVTVDAVTKLKREIISDKTSALVLLGPIDESKSEDLNNKLLFS